MTNHLVNVAGDVAQAFTYGSWRLVRTGLDGGEMWEGTGWYDDKLVRTGDGWRIRHRICRITRWSGNPRVNETMPEVKFELDSTKLRREADEGRISYLNAVSQK
jgi:hypothetical protein